MSKKYNNTIVDNIIIIILTYIIYFILTQLITKIIAMNHYNQNVFMRKIYFNEN